MLIQTTRRSFLTALASAGVAAPVALTLGRNAMAAPGALKALFLYVPDGVIPSAWHPSGTGTNFTLPAMSAPLEAVRDDVVFVRGTNMYAGGHTHEGGVHKFITGAGDISLDVFLGQEIGGDTPLRSLQLGVATGFQGSLSVSYVGAGQLVTPDDNPLNVFSRMFGQPVGQTADLVGRQGASILDLAITDVQRLQGYLGGPERAKLEVHLESLREVERKITGQVTQVCGDIAWDDRGFRVLETDYYPTTFHKEEHFALMSEMQSELAVLALQCGVTNVATIMWSHPVSPTKILDIGSSMGHHDSSHYGAADSAAAQSFTAQKAWFFAEIAALLQHMKSIPDGDRTLLGNSLVFMGTDINDGNLHDHTDMPFVLAGQAGGQLTTGRSLDYRGTLGGENEAHSRILVSIANMMGAPVDTFGYEGAGPGGLPGLEG